MNPEKPLPIPTEQVSMFDENGDPTPETLTAFERETQRFKLLTNGQDPAHYEFSEKNITKLEQLNIELENDPTNPDHVRSVLAGRTLELDKELPYTQR